MTYPSDLKTIELSKYSPETQEQIKIIQNTQNNLNEILNYSGFSTDYKLSSINIIAKKEWTK